MNWQPIETAPKDGTAVWLIVEGRRFLGFFDPDNAPWAKPQWFIKSTVVPRGNGQRTDTIMGCYGFGVEPTHWQPLPELPR
jgi:hypothetical protein